MKKIIIMSDRFNAFYRLMKAQERYEAAVQRYENAVNPIGAIT